MAIKLRDSDTDEVTEIPTEAASLLACLMCLVHRAGGHVTISKEEIDRVNGTLVQAESIEVIGVDLDLVLSTGRLAS